MKMKLPGMACPPSLGWTRALARLAALVMVLLLAAPVAPTQAAGPGKRIALLIGIDAYGEDVGRLRNPLNDVSAIASTLEAIGFRRSDIAIVRNPTSNQMLTAIEAFSGRVSRLGNDDIALFYYSGHGVKIRRGAREKNFLLPRDVASVAGSSAFQNAVSLQDDVIEPLGENKFPAVIVAIDACRNELRLPVGRNVSGNKGFQPPTPMGGMLISFAADDGQVAKDAATGGSRMSPYAIALAQILTQPGQKVSTAFSAIRPEVVRLTKGEQEPVVVNKLNSDPVLVPGASPDRLSERPPVEVPEAREPEVTEAAQELEAWKSLGTDPSKAELEAFLKAFPNGKYAGLARAKIKTIEERERAQARPAAPAPSTTAPAETRPAQVAGPGKDCAECPEMVRIPGRSFMAGKYEVTFAEWDACVAGGGCNGYRPADEGWGRGRHPVIHVSWYDAQAYVQWLSNRTGKRYRLLTSEEWEFAARPGTTTEYSWGNEEPVCNESARNGANFDACPDDRTRPVGSFPANGFGLHDVHGNVWEWVEDCYDGDCSRRVLRGGSWGFNPLFLRSAYRDRSDPSVRSYYIGFRVARTL
jgi:formylglycine-generating enzyme required for sulfatase activity